MVAVEVGPKERPSKKQDGRERIAVDRPVSRRSSQRAPVVHLPTDGALPPLRVHRFLGLDFHTLSMPQAVAEINARASQKRQFAYVVTPNVDHRVRLDREPDLLPIYEKAWLTLCDSRILEILSSIDGRRIESVPGADVVEQIVATHLDRDEPVNIVGESAEVIDKLKARYGLRNINWHNPPFGLRHNRTAIEEAAEFVEQHPARFTFICVGSPQQELVAEAISRRPNAVGVGLCCGASLGFLTGSVQRAPRLMRRLALEWLHRLMMEPKRMYRRYLIDGPAIFPIWRRYRSHPIEAVGVQVPTAERVPSNDAAPLLEQVSK